MGLALEKAYSNGAFDPNLGKKKRVRIGDALMFLNFFVLNTLSHSLSLSLKTIHTHFPLSPSRRNFFLVQIIIFPALVFENCIFCELSFMSSKRLLCPL